MKVLCVDSKNRPNEVPVSRWVSKDKEYTIVKVCYMVQQDIYGCKLEELNNDDLYPWSYFALNRFAISKQEILEAVEEKQLELEEI